MNHKKDLLTTGELVTQLFIEFPETRNSDLLLQWVYLKRFHGLDMPQLTYDQIKELEGKTETIRRMRQKIQNTDKRYPPTRKEVMKRRGQKEDDYRDFFGKGSK